MTLRVEDVAHKLVSHFAWVALVRGGQVKLAHVKLLVLLRRLVLLRPIEVINGNLPMP